MATGLSGNRGSRLVIASRGDRRLAEGGRRRLRGFAERDKTSEFSARKSCFEKSMTTREELGDCSHQWVVFQHFERT